jgi:hypothetical protein
MTKSEKEKLIDMRIGLLLEAVERMREDFLLPSGRSLLPQACDPVLEAAHKLREALTR